MLNGSVSSIGIIEYHAVSTKYPPVKVKIADTRLKIRNIFTFNFLFITFISLSGIVI